MWTKHHRPSYQVVHETLRYSKDGTLPRLLLCTRQKTENQMGVIWASPLCYDNSHSLWARSSSTPPNVFLKSTAIPAPMRQSSLMQCARASVGGQVNRSPLLCSSRHPELHPSCNKWARTQTQSKQDNLLSYIFYYYYWISLNALLKFFC